MQSSNPSYYIRLARFEELEQLQDIERAAGTMFRDTAYGFFADDDPADIELMRAQQRAGLVWAACDAEDVPVGFIFLVILEGGPHIQELSVHPLHGRRGLGKRLVDAVCEWAAGQGYAFMTLTTFADVPWNGPYYERLGFRVLAKDELDEGLKHVLFEEQQAGLPMETRVVMRREIATAQEKL